MHIVTKGIVLRETNYKDADKILTVLTDQLGKCTVKARGCRRKGSALSASAQLLVYSDMTLLEYRDRLTLTEGATLELFPRVRRDLERLALGSYFAQAVEAVAQEGEADAALLALLLNCLYALNGLDRPASQVKAAFELRLLEAAGFGPRLEGCALCGAEQPEQPFLNLRSGLLHCRDCRAVAEGGISMPLSAGALAAMRYICASPRRFLSFRLDEGSLGLLSNAAEAFLLTQLERGFQTLDFWKSLQGAPGLNCEKIENTAKKD
ncbi:MAG: DNA repair protein RecO [Oscillospiraceae bacterium]|nr:DNA repair protein RecO [Oscillospiraceae bacterium]